MGFFARLFGWRSARDASESLRASELALEHGDPPRAYALALAGLRVCPESTELLLLASRICTLRADALAAALFSRAALSREDAAAWLELAELVRTEGDATTAAALLSCALELAPFDAVLRSELALCYAQAGQPERVVETLALHPCLGTDAGVLYQFGWSSLLAGDAEAAQSVVEQLQEAPGARALSRRLRSALSRATLPAAADPPDARDYFYLEYGGVLLTRGPSRGAFDALEVDDAHLAIFANETRRALSLVDGAVHKSIAFVGDEAPGLCERFATYFGSEVQALPEHGRIPSWILVASDAHAFEPLRDRLAGSVADGARLVALTMSQRHAHRVVPQIVGAFASRVRFRLDAKTAEPARPSLTAESFVRERSLAIRHAWAAVEGNEPFSPDFPVSDQR